jgi:hypothetical protein
MDADRRWHELSPSRRSMIETLISHEGVSEYSAALTFRRGDISWGLRRKLIAERPYKDRTELYATDAGRAALAASR